VVGKAKVIIEILILLLLLIIPTLFRLVTTIKDQVISMSLSATFTAAICNESEALSGRHASQVPYTSALKRRESRAQLARALATRAVIAKDRCVVWNIMDAQPKTYHDRSCLSPRCSINTSKRIFAGAMKVRDSPSTSFLFRHFAFKIRYCIQCIENLNCARDFSAKAFSVFSATSDQDNQAFEEALQVARHTPHVTLHMSHITLTRETLLVSRHFRRFCSPSLTRNC
jgi:hypothetical protein